MPPMLMIVEACTDNMEQKNGIWGTFKLCEPQARDQTTTSVQRLA